MAKRTDLKIAVLVQVMADIGFDQDIIGRVTGVPLRTISDLANRRGYWSCTGNCNELRESYRLYLRKFILDGSTALAGVVLERLQVIAQHADLVTAINIASAVATLATKFDDRR